MSAISKKLINTVRIDNSESAINSKLIQFKQNGFVEQPGPVRSNSEVPQFQINNRVIKPNFPSQLLPKRPSHKRLHSTGEFFHSNPVKIETISGQSNTLYNVLNDRKYQMYIPNETRWNEEKPVNALPRHIGRFAKTTTNILQVPQHDLLHEKPSEQRNSLLFPSRFN